MLAWFLFINRDSLGVFFASDEMMNIDHYWRLKPWQLVFSPFLLWQSFYRPMGGLFYTPIFYFAGLNPAPFHVAALLLLLAIAFLVYRWSQQLGCPQAAAWLAALIPCYHAGLDNLYYDGSQIYDVLCCFFYLAALVYYAHIRSRGRFFTWRQLVVFLSLFLFALNSKEMAVTLPPMLLAYEWLYHGGPRWKFREFADWLNGPGRAIGWATILCLIFLYGRVLSPQGLANQPGYRPVFSMHRVWEFQILQIADLLTVYKFFDRGSVIAVWLVVTWLAWRRPRPVLRICWIHMLVTPLPIEFLLGRAQAALFVPMIGWAVFASVVLTDVVGAVAEFLSREPVLRRLDRRVWFAVLIVAAAAGWMWRNWSQKESFILPSMTEMGSQTKQMIHQMQELHPKVKAGGLVVFLNDPFDPWDMYFIADLWFRDPSLRIKLNRKTPMTAEEIAGAECVIDYRDGRLVRIQ